MEKIHAAAIDPLPPAPRPNMVRMNSAAVPTAPYASHSGSLARATSAPTVVPEDEMVEQIPVLQNAWKEIESARRALQVEKEELDMRMKGEWSQLRKQLSDLSSIKTNGASSAPAPALIEQAVTYLDEDDDDYDDDDGYVVDGPTRSNGSPSNDGGRIRTLSLTEELQEFAAEIDMRSRLLASQAEAATEDSPATRRSRRASMEAVGDASKLSSAAAELNRRREARAKKNEQADSKKDSVKKGPSVPDFLVRDVTESEVGVGGKPAIRDALEDELAELRSAMDYAAAEVEAIRKAREEAIFVDEKGGYYDVLGVEVDCTSTQLKKAHRKKMIRWHPDKNRDNIEEAREMTGRLQTAYEVLSDTWQRTLYDWLKLEQFLLHTQVVVCFKNYLNTGIHVKKHGRKGLKYFPKKRFLWTDRECLVINTAEKRIVEATEKEEVKIKSVKVMNISAIHKGMSTAVLKRKGNKATAHKYFSIITPERTLDLQAETRKVRDFLVSRLTLLVIDTLQDMEWLQDFYEKHRGKSEKGAKEASKDSPPPPPPRERE